MKRILLMIAVAACTILAKADIADTLALSDVTVTGIKQGTVNNSAPAAITVATRPTLESNGVTGTNNSSDYTTPWSWNLGDTLSLGDACGKVDKAWTNSGGTAVQNASHVSLFGSEDNFCFWQMLQGIYCGSSSNSGQDGTEVFIYKGNRLPTSTELATHPAGDYRTITRLTTEGYINKMLLGQHFDIFASATGGGGDSYWCDYQYANDTGQLVLLGGDARSGAACGLSYVYSRNVFSLSYASYGSRLAYYGDIDLVDGADLATA